MQVSYNWLKDYVDIDVDVFELAEIITRAGVEIGGIEATNKGVTNVVVAEVLECSDHPDSDHLHVCVVTTDGSDRVQVVCGAPNVAAGQKVPFAKVGATLPGDFVIRQTVLRGQESNGMICSMQELGVPEELVAAEDKNGIRVLPIDAPLGVDAMEYLGMNDHIMELDLTPNRSDCLSVYNIAREVAALLQKKIRPIHAPAVEGTAVFDKMKVDIEAPELCHRFTGTMVSGAKVGRSPIWMEHRLQCAGMRPISNLVDVTNYVMLEMGQPLHAYDYTTLAGPAINVRRAHEGETIVTLDGQERKLTPEQLLICDAERAVGLAGVMGGENTEIRDTTEDVFIESAYFEPRNIRRTSVAFGLRSEAAIRNEKDVNIEITGLAGWRCAHLMAETAGAEILSGQIDNFPTPHARPEVTLRYQKCNDVIGAEIPAEEMRDILVRLGFVVLTEDADGVTVQVPPHRPDVSIEEDLIEEVARLFGYDNIPETLPFGATSPGMLTAVQRMEQIVKHTMAGLGLNEVINYSFHAQHHADRLRWAKDDTRRAQITVTNPLSEDQVAMRTTLLSGMLGAVATNRRYQNNDVALFEVGRIFLGADQINKERLADEREILGIALCGGTKEDWIPGSRIAYDFYYLKGLLQALMKALGIDAYSFEALTDDPSWHPGRSARLLLDGEVIGIFGEVHPLVSRAYDLKEAVYAAEIFLDPLYAHGVGTVMAEALPKYPPVTRDLALVVDADRSAQTVDAAIVAAGARWLKSVELFDVFVDERLGAGKKSLAYALVFQSDDETLQDEWVQAEVDKIIAHTKTACGAALRA